MHSLKVYLLACIPPLSCINTEVHLDSNLGEQYQLRKVEFLFSFSCLFSVLVFSLILVLVKNRGMILCKRKEEMCVCVYVRERERE